MKTEFTNKISRGFHKVGFGLKKHSPEIMLVAGVAGMVTSTVMACKATTKLDSILSETKQTVEHIHNASEAGEVNGVEYSKEDGKKDLTIVYTQTGLKLAKLYGPAILLGAASIASIFTSHRILSKRNIALATAYAAIDSSFKGYRERLVERFGDSLDKELRYGIKAEEVTETTINENGEEVETTEIINTARINNSDYARFFDDGCNGWSKDPEVSLMFLRRQQDWANEKLKSRGYLFLNEVYDMLGIHRTTAGQVVGWVYDSKRGDGFIDFGIYDLSDEDKRAFVNGKERVIILDFNVDGNIWNDVFGNEGSR